MLSIFAPTEPCVLLVGGERAILYLFDGGELQHAYLFDADEGGLALFERCLRELDLGPVAVLVDVVEEEYRQDTVPHVGAVDRRAVLERKYARLFRGTPYHHALRQGRETEGRRDDRVLLTALTRPELLSPWMDKLLQFKVPVTGIYSLPLLSAALLKRIDAGGSNVLLISLQRASGLRQTFFRDGQFKISRLAHVPRVGSVPFADLLLGEVEKLRRYLNSLALVSRDSPLSIYILSQGALLDELKAYCHDTEQERFVLLDLEQVTRGLGLREAGASHFSDVLFARLLAMSAPRNHYAQPAESQFYTLHRLRRGLVNASLGCLLASIAWSGMNFVEGVNFKRQALDETQRAAYYQDRYGVARRKLPATPVEPREIETAVTAAATLRRYKNEPATLLGVVGSALAAAPQVELDQLSWTGSADPKATVQESTARRSGQATVRTPVASGGGYYQIAEITAHLQAFDGDYGRAIGIVDDLAKALKTQDRVVTVQVLQYPLDVRSESSVSGSAVAAGEIAASGFKLRLVLGVDDGRQSG